MTLVLWVIFGILFVSFLLIVFRGAPYVPTRARDLDDLFSLYKFKKRDVLVDLGSGDGRVLVAAARRGIRSVGYELNPFLVISSWLQLRKYRTVATVRFADFWTTPLPKETAVVFVFLAGPFMKRLDTKLSREAQRLGHDIVLISYGVKMPGHAPEKTKGGFLVYRFEA